MTDTKSKADERWYAARLGTVRTPLSGGNSRHTRSDTLDPDIYLEVKTGRSFPTSWDGWTRLFCAVEENAMDEGRIPVLVLHPHRQPRQDALTFFRVPDGVIKGVAVQVQWWVFEQFVLADLRRIHREHPSKGENSP